MDGKFFCAVKGRKIEEHECSSIIMKADAATINTCRTCTRGQALARTTSIVVKQLDPAAVAASATAQAVKAEPVSKGAWPLIAERSGCDSQEKLAKKIGGTYQSKISQIVVKLSKGVTPSGRTWDRLLEITGLMPEELLLAAGHRVRAASPAESSPASSLPVDASSPLTPDGSASSSAEPSGPAGHMMSMQDEHGPQGDMARQSFDRAGEALGLDVLPHAAAIPADFMPYTGGQAPRPLVSKPSLRVTSGHDCELSAGAVREFGLSEAARVRLLWSKARGQLGVLVVKGEERGGGVLTLQQGRGVDRKRIAAASMFRRFGVAPKPGTYPLERHPSGLLVATITQQPAQTGGEA